MTQHASQLARSSAQIITSVVGICTWDPQGRRSRKWQRPLRNLCCVWVTRGPRCRTLSKICCRQRIGTHSECTMTSERKVEDTMSQAHCRFHLQVLSTCTTLSTDLPLTLLLPSLRVHMSSVTSNSFLAIVFAQIVQRSSGHMLPRHHTSLSAPQRAPRGHLCASSCGFVLNIRPLSFSWQRGHRTFFARDCSVRSP